MNLVKKVFVGSLLFSLQSYPNIIHISQEYPQQENTENKQNFDAAGSRYSIAFIAAAVGSGFLGASFYCTQSCFESSNPLSAAAFGIGSAMTGVLGLGLNVSAVFIASPLGRTMLESIHKIEYQEEVAAKKKQAQAWQIYIDGQEKQRKEETVKRKMIDKFRRMQERLFKEFSH